MFGMVSIDATAGYGRRANNSYNGVQIGYDKLLGKNFYNGKIYTGFYFTKIDGDSHTTTGNGEQNSYGIGLYSSWVGNKGHYLDAAINAAKLKNDYYFTGNTGDGTIGQVKGNSNTWGYGLGLQYGKRNEFNQDGWFWEPSASFFLGHVDENSYTLGNGLAINEKGYDTAIGKLGLKAGKDFGDKAHVYTGISYGKEFAGGQDVHQSYGSQTGKILTTGGNDTWWEWSVGAKAKISPTGIFTLDYIKTTGSDLGNEWSINGGFNWSWGGFSPVKAKQAKVAGETTQSFAKAQTPTVVLGMPQVDNITVPQLGGATTVVVENSNDNNNTINNANTENTYVASSAPATTSTDGNLNIFDLGGLTVEAQRPDWEKNLSPGQVSVIYPKAFEGEQKNLPELLDRVPGLFIQRVNGVGHYTVARMRGSTAAQVSVFVDGVMMNLTGDAAVNLSAIPAENIERIEVYRGYVPARFAGAPMGGVINIITKKPTEGHGHIRQGVRSYGGYTADYEYSMPLGSGSLMATYSRDIWQGDFDFTYPSYNWDGTSEEFNRRSNGYQNNNGMLKWQDEHWTVKATWKKMHEELAVGMVNKYLAYNTKYDYLDRYLDLNYKEILIGHRNTIGNLDYGWHLAYVDSEKHYVNTGAYRLIEDSANNTKPENIYKVTENSYLPGQLWGNYHSKKWNGNLNLSMKMGTNHMIELNADFTRETMNANGNRWDLTQEAIDQQTGATYRVRKMLSKYNNREYHLTLQDTITLNDDGDFKLTPILRADKVEIEGLGGAWANEDNRWKYSGALALQKQINKQWSFKTSWGTYNRHPNFYEIFGDGGFIGQNYGFTTGGTKGMGLWESGRQFDFSLNWQGKIAKADTDTILTYYKRRAENQMILWTPRGGNGLSFYAPTSALDSYGIELSHNMKWQRLNISLAATWQKSNDISDKVTHNWGPTGSSFVPEWVINARMDYLFPGDKLNIFGEYSYTDREVLAGDDSNDDTYYRKAYSVVNLGVKYKFDKAWRLNVGVNDIFDKGKDVFIVSRSYHYANTYPLVGRMYYTTLEYSF